MKYMNNLENYQEETELSEKEKEYKIILEERGMIYQGIQEIEDEESREINRFVCFRTGENYNWSNGMAISVEDFNRDSLETKINENIDKKIK